MPNPPVPDQTSTVVEIPTQWQAAFQQAADRYGVPVNILALVAKAESGFDPGAVGDNGSSYGFFQIHLPAHPDVNAAQALDPMYNLNWGAQELAQAYQRYNGNALATVLFNNCPVCADHYAATGQYGPTKALADASQRYLGQVLAPVGGLSVAGTTGTDWIAAQGTGTSAAPAQPPPESPAASFLSAFSSIASGTTSGADQAAAAPDGMLSALGVASTTPQATDATGQGTVETTDPNAGLNTETPPPADQTTQQPQGAA